MDEVVLTFAGSKVVAGQHTLPELWLNLHNMANRWLTLGTDISVQLQRLSIDERTAFSAKRLSSATSDEWSNFCSAAGMTVYGAIALSWCKDAELSQVWEGWHASGFPLKPSPEFERPARFINPALMPPLSSLREILDAEAGKHEAPEVHSLAICARIAAVQGPLNFDMPQDSLRNAPPQIAAFLKSRMLEKPDRTAEENALIETWSTTIKGTEFDIWEDA